MIDMREYENMSTQRLLNIYRDMRKESFQRFGAYDFEDYSMGAQTVKEYLPDEYELMDGLKKILDSREHVSRQRSPVSKEKKERGRNYRLRK